MSVPYSEGRNRLMLGLSEAHFMLYSDLDKRAD